MNKQKIFTKKSIQQGSVLIEALIAILIFSMGILALVGLQAAMVQNTTNSKYRIDASYIAQQRIGTMWADPANAANYLEANTDISNLLPGGRRTVTQPIVGSFRVIVGWTVPGEVPSDDTTEGPCFMLVAHCFTTVANVVGG